MTPTLWEKVMNVLIQKNGISKNELFRKSKYGNKNKFFEYLDEWESEERIEINQVGREKQVSLASSDKKIKTFIKNYGKGLDNYEKLLKKHLTELEKSLPLISPTDSMKQIKTKTGVLELDKKRQVYRHMGKTRNTYAYTWKTRTKPRKHFEFILSLLNNLYQESSVIVFSIPISDNPSVTRKYQTKSQDLIDDTIKKIENMFRDKIDFAFVVYRIRIVLHGLIYKATLEKEMKS